MIKKIKAKLLFGVCVLLGFLLFSFHSMAQSTVLKTVVIDAGHGGKDPGCHGAQSNEKTVCLNMALKLGQLIKLNYPDIKVVYTRATDVFIELDERAKIANKNNADLFICIHANAASPSAAGTETYVLGLHRTESQQKIAERENATIYLEDDKGLKYKDFDLSPDAIIARQLQLSVFLDQSISFATKLQDEFTKIGRYNRGVKQAGFLVLYKTTMPSVLIETGFLTNPEEERFLASEEKQTLMAESMFGAFAKYKCELEGLSYEEKAFKKLPIEKKSVEEKVELKKEELKEVRKTEKSVTTTAENAIATYKKSLNMDSTTVDAKVEFRVQIQTSKVRLPFNSSKFKNLPVQEYTQDGLFKYTVGNFENDFSSANKYKNELIKEGFEHAFVVAFLGGERIDIQKGINLAKK